jgi:short-subunit dehydrogenase
MTKTVAILGASAGIGRATALHFGKHKYSVGLIARNADRLQSLKEEIEQSGGKATTAVCDSAYPDQIEAAAQKIESELGEIEIWINNAMVSVFAPFVEITDEEFKRVTEVTYLGFVYGTHVALKRMLPRDRGIIIQVGSALAYRGIPLQSAYCGAKHAIRGFTSSLRCELMHQKSKVKVTMVQMPALNTPQFNWVRSRLPRKPQPVPPIYQPEVAANAIFWAASHYRREWDVGISTLIAIMGNKLFPGIADRYLARTGFDSQQYNGPRDPSQPDNLYKTVDGPFGAHGDFDSKAKPRSAQLWLSQHRRSVWVTGIALLLIVILASTLN